MRILYKNFRWKHSDEFQQLLVQDDKILYRGPDSPENGLETFVADKTGFRLYPSFVDNHTHVLPTGLDLAKLNLSSANSHAEVLELLSERHRDQPEGWLLAVHYDQNRYAGKHLTSKDLDAISCERPILLRHSSGHAGVANFAALQAAKIRHDIEDEQGATYRRDESGQLNGLLLEHALEQVSRSIPRPSLEEMVQAILAATDKMSSENISLTSDMQTGFMDLIDELHAYRLAAERGAKIAVRLYLQWGRVFGPRAPQPDQLREVINSFDGDRCRVQGIKLFADGAIGSGTAAIYGNYVDSEVKSETSGTLIYRPELLKSRILHAAKEGWQVSVHAIGDYASDLVMSAFEDTSNPSMHRLEHGMILSDAQIERIAKINCRVSVQPEFLHLFGATYRSKLRKEKSWDLIRFKSLISAGIRTSFSSDRPITTGNPLLGIEMATNRPQGFNPAENCTLPEALEAYTTAGAEATLDESDYGSLETGSPARLNWIEV